MWNGLIITPFMVEVSSLRPIVTQWKRLRWLLVDVSEKLREKKTNIPLTSPRFGPTPIKNK